jgi:hypothetical protein
MALGHPHRHRIPPPAGRLRLSHSHSPLPPGPGNRHPGATATHPAWPPRPHGHTQDHQGPTKIIQAAA